MKNPIATVELALYLLLTGEYKLAPQGWLTD
jgi:hypothetical protein